ncbi:TadE/TadG family type IV pilus assembly protein [Duganella aceris]|uniref:Pilus assembly protein n=1 Tax=Duganella aceris TaxID=2703883 RepID=A0ABX0FQ53_9BURK|nr:TadE/TadG family type IV pilus assembly protein [Duganella aceris]NGZ86494.1 pilus assembly protein [Duganella aceris]
MRVHRLLRRRQNGSAAVEMAIIAPVAMLLLIGIIEFSIVFFVTLSMQYAVREGARYAITGRVDKDPATANRERYKAVLASIKSNSMGMYDSLSPVITVNGTSYAAPSSYAANMFGGPEDIVVLRIDCTWNLSTPLISAFFPGGKYKFAVAATMRNEDFPPL